MGRTRRIRREKPIRINTIRVKPIQTDPIEITAQISVVIPTMWRSDKLLKMLDIYERSSFITEVVIIDNEPSRRMNITHSKVKIHTRGENIYVNPAWNWGVALSENEDIIIANDDVVIEELSRITREWINCQYELLGVNHKDNLHKKNITLIDANKLEYGFGCFMFVKKSKYLQLPYDLKIWRGDFLLRKHLHSGMFSGVYLDTDMSTTVNEFRGKAAKDTHQWKAWKALKKDLTVIINTYNRLEYTKKCISTFKKYTTCKWFMIIVDNGSTDGTREWLETLDKTQTMIVLSEDNLMPRRTNQLGLQLSFPSTHYLLCDNDGEFTKNWYENSLKILNKSDIACLRKSRWLPTHRYGEEVKINKIDCYDTKYIASFSIMNHEMRDILVAHMKGMWIGVQIGELALAHGKRPVQVKDGYIIDQSDNELNSPKYREQYLTLWKQKKQMHTFVSIVNDLNKEQGNNEQITNNE